MTAITKILLLSVLACGGEGFSFQTKFPLISTQTRLFAAGGGAPQYEKIQASLREAEEVGEGSVMLHIDTKETVDYEPGHVLALEIQHPDNIDDKESKAFKDAQTNGGWMRGPYTVSRATSNSLDILVKVVGEKSKHFAASEPGTPLQFGGKFKVPILEGISTDTTKKVVLISTGVGVGPCIGAIEKALQQEKDIPPISLLASYRNENEILYKDHLDELQAKNPEAFSWKSIVTNQVGRLSASDDNLKLLGSSSDLQETHYHLIGNGQLVQEFQAGLQKAGVPDDKVTVEMYFNHKADVDAEVVDRIADAVSTMAGSNAVTAV